MCKPCAEHITLMDDERLAPFIQWKAEQIRFQRWKELHAHRALYCYNAGEQSDYWALEGGASRYFQDAVVPDMLTNQANCDSCGGSQDEC